MEYVILASMTYKTLLIDLDDTVYPAGNGLWEAIAGRIDRYMHEKLGLHPAEIPALRKRLHAQYGTTLRGLAATRHVDELDYLSFVHDIPVQNYLTPNPAVREALLACPLRKVIFTNADRGHAERVLTALSLRDVFEDVIDILDIRPYCKPMPEAFSLALTRAGCSAEECIFLDDSTRNLEGARLAGLAGILVGGESPPGGDFSRIPGLESLPVALAVYLPHHNPPSV